MDYIAVLKRVWKESKRDVLRAGYNLAVLAFNSTFRLGRFIGSLDTKFKQEEIIRSAKSTKDAYRATVERSMDIYRSDVHTITGRLNDLEKPYVFDVEGVLVVAGILDEQCHVIVRGSSNIDNWTDSLNAGMQWSPRMKSMVHDGYLEIARTITDTVANYIDTVSPGISKISVAGHSMGGGLATMVGYIIHNESLYVVDEVVSIGGPKVIQADYGDVNVTHIFHIQDPIPYVPVWSFFTPYRHQGKRVIIMPDGNIKMFKDSHWADLRTSVWVLTHRLDVAAHSNYDLHFKED